VVGRYPAFGKYRTHPFDLRDWSVSELSDAYAAQLQLAYGWVGLGIKTNIVAVVVLVPAIFWFVPRYGVIGAAWIWVILNAGYVLIAIQLMHRRLYPNEKWRWYFADVMLPLIGAAGIMLLAKQFQPVSYQDRWSDFFFLSITAVLALMASAILADRVRPKLMSFLRQDSHIREGRT